MNRLKRSISVFLLCILMAGLLVGCGTDSDKSFKSEEDFEKAEIGLFLGSSFDLLAKEHFPKAKKVYFPQVTDLILTLQQGKIDGILMDEAYFAPLSWDDDRMSAIEMDMPPTEYAVIFSKGPSGAELAAEMNEFIAGQKENGWLDEQEKKWFSDSEPEGGTPDFSKLTGENGTLRVATSAELKPFSYLKNGSYAGYDADFIYKFAEEYGYALDIDIMDFGAILPGISAGRFDLAIAGITVTEERKESVRYSDIIYESPILMAVLGGGDRERTKLSDFEDAKIGIATGSSHDKTAKIYFPDAERKYYKTITDMVIAVEQGKIDCYIEDAQFMYAAIWNGANVKSIDEPITQVSNGFVFPQTEESVPLREELNEFIAKSEENGTIDRLLDKWLTDTEPTEHPDYKSLSGENGIIRLAVCVDSKPILYKHRDGCSGFEMDLLTLFAEEKGYAFEIEELAFESIIAGITSGKYDMGAASLNITAEREESVDFSDPYTSFDVVLVTKGDASEQNLKFTTLEDFENATLGIHTGTVYEDFAKERFPNAERKYYTLMSDMILAVEQGKIDGYISEKPYVAAAIWEGAQIHSLDYVIAQTNAAYIFQKGDEAALLRQQMDEFLIESKENGFIDLMMEKWFGNTEPDGDIDYDALTGENGTLKIAVALDLKPISYLKNDKLTGYEIELLWHFAKKHGYDLDMEYMTFNAILPGVTTGKYDIGTGGVTITEERAESVAFSESHLTVDVVMVVRGVESSATGMSFFDDLKSSFEKTFIREDRWKLMVEGVAVTLLISVCSAVAGTLLGFVLYMLSRSDIKLIMHISRGSAKVYSRIIAGTPVVVILMILYYVIFGKIRDISGIFVAIVGFSLTFGAFVYDHLQVAVSSVDRGQIEAAYSLGYTKNKTFFRIVMPQAMSIFLPSYCGHVVDLVKATAVVGYIAVNDLTKMGDIIRSNTYEAFFPLIATALIYFMLTWLLTVLLGLVRKHFEPKRRSSKDILKGVKTV